MTATCDLIKGKIPCRETGIDVRKSICAICDPLNECGLDLYVRDGEIIKVEGTQENGFSRGTLCSKGAATRQYVYSPDRLKTPLKRAGEKGEGRFEEITWDEAYQVITDKLLAAQKDLHPESVAFYVGYPKWLRPYVQRMAFSYGSPNFCTESSTCFKAMLLAWKLVYGTGSVPDVKNAGCLIVWSANPMYSCAPSAEILFNRKDAGMKLIVVDPRLTPTAALADVHLRLRPGTDGALALGLANVIVSENLHDKEFIEKYSCGFSEYKELIRQFTPERTSELTGVPAAKIIEAARMYATVKPAAFMPAAQAVVHHTNGVQNYRAAMMLIGLTGNFDVQGGNVVVKPSYLDMPCGIDTNCAAFAMPKPWSSLLPRIGHTEVPAWNELIDEAQAMFLPDYIIDGKPYPVKTMIGFGVNHRMWADSNRMEKALGELDFFVNLDLFMTDTCRFADIVLPVCTTVERSEFWNYSGGFVIHTLPAIKPLHQSISDLDFIFELSRRLKLNDELLQAGYEASINYILDPSGMTMEELVKHPGGMTAKGFKPPVYKKYEAGGFKTPSGKMEFVSGVLSKYKDLDGHDPLPVYAPPKQSAETTPDLFREYPFIINTGSRLPMFIHSRTFRLPWTKALRPRPAADLNPDDAAKLGIKQGDAIKICTPKGEISVFANISDMVLEGVVCMYHGYKEADVNSIISGGYLDPVSGYPGFKSFLGKIVKAG